MVKLIGIVAYLLIAAIAVSGFAVPPTDGGTAPPTDNFGTDFVYYDRQYDYVGCFRDVFSDRDVLLGGVIATTISDGNTPENCANWCLVNHPGATVMAVQNGVDCWCGDTFGKHGPSLDCNVPCPGDMGSGSRTCGGYYAEQVYTMSPVPVTIDSVNPDICEPNGVMTITGSGFGMVPSRVTVNYVDVTVLFWNLGTIVIVLPPWASTGSQIEVQLAWGMATYALTCNNAPREIYPEVVSCTSWGDPHIVTYAGLTFDFQVAGEFLMSRVGDVEVQTRQLPCNGPIQCNFAVAMRYKTDVFGVYGFNGVTVYKNGQPITLPHSLADGLVSLVGNEYRFQFGNITVVARHWGHFDVIITIPTNTTHSVFPINGGFCFRLEKSWVGRNMTVKYAVSGQNEIDTIASSWRVLPAESLFDYTITIENYDAFNKPGRGGAIVDKMPLDRAKEACNVLLTSECADLIPVGPFFTACVDDVRASGDVSLAQHALVAFSKRCVIEHPIVESLLAFPTIPSSCVVVGSGRDMAQPVVSSRTLHITAINSLGQKSAETSDSFFFKCGDAQCNMVHSNNVGPGEYEITFTTPDHAGNFRFTVYSADGSAAVVAFWDVLIFDPEIVPTITRVNPDDILVGGTITIVGSDLQRCSGTVSVNGHATSIVSWTNAEIVVVLPSIVEGGVTLTVVACNGETETVINVRPPTIPDPQEVVRCSSWGDPHLTTFMNVHYDFQGHGEYWFTRVSGVDIQVRQAPCSPGSWVTCNTGIAVGFEGHTVGFYTHNWQPMVVVDGALTTGPYPLFVGTGHVAYDGGVHVFQINGVTLNVYSLGSFLGIVVEVVPAVRNITGGLCNILHSQWQYGRPDYELKPITTFNEFGTSWQITNTTSLFVYTVTGTSFPYHNPGNGPVDPPQPPIVDPRLRAAAENICRALLDVADCAGQNVNPGAFFAACVFDVIATGNTAVAEQTLAIWQRMCNPPGTTPEPVPSSTTPPVVTEGPVVTTETPPVGCVIPDPQDLHTSVAPYIGVSVNPTQFKIVVYVAKVNTRVIHSITFLHHTFTMYDYIGGQVNELWTWEDVPELCLDKYTVIVPMDDLTTAHISHVAGTYHFSGSVWVNTNEILSDEETERDSTYELRFDFTFPVADASSIAVEIIANIDVRVVTSKVILQQAQEDRSIDVTLEVGVMHPYQLNWVHDVLDIDGGASFPEVLAPNVEYLDGTGVSLSTTALTEHCTNAAGTVCKQRFKFTIDPNDLCDADGRYIVSLAADKCVGNDDCLAHDGNHKDYKAIEIIMTLELGQLCAEEHDLVATLSQLRVHSDVARTVVPASFDIDEIVYFSTEATSTGDCEIGAVELITAIAECHAGNCVAGTTSNQFGNVVHELAPSVAALRFHIPSADLTFAPLSASSVIVRITAVIYFDCTDGKREIRYVHADIPNVSAEAQATFALTKSDAQVGQQSGMSGGALAGVVVGAVAGVAAVAVIAVVAIKSTMAAAAAKKYMPVMDML